jgi:hypothetical protein
MIVVNDHYQVFHATTTNNATNEENEPHAWHPEIFMGVMTTILGIGEGNVLHQKFWKLDLW